nr:hypothetical protein [Tanacetum cinerariifolium]
MSEARKRAYALNGEILFKFNGIFMRVLHYVNGKTSHGKKQKANVSIKKRQKKQQPKVKKTKKVGFIKRLTTPKPSKPRFFLRWSPTGRLFDVKEKIIASSESESQSDCSNGDNACCSKHMTGNLKLLINFVWKFTGTVRFENDHVATILGFSDIQWGNILITRVYFIEGLGHNLFSIGQFCDSDLEARASSTKSWLWHQSLSHLNFDTINDLAKNDLVSGLPKFKYHKEHLCSSCEHGKSKRASHPPKPVPNSRQRLHLLHMDLCGPMRIASINGKRSKPGLQSMTSRQISLGLDLTYAPSTITTQQPSEGKLDLLFEAMYDDFIGGQPSAAQRTISAAQAQQVHQTSTTSTSIAETAPTPTNS